MPTPEAHARFESFLKQHPAPDFVTVQHEGFTRVHVDADWSKIDYPRPNDRFNALFAGFGGGGVFGLGGAAMAIAGVAGILQKTPAPGAILAASFGAAGAVFGITMLATAIGEVRAAAPKLPSEFNRALEEIRARN